VVRLPLERRPHGDPIDLGVADGEQALLVAAVEGAERVRDDGDRLGAHPPGPPRAAAAAASRSGSSPACAGKCVNRTIPSASTANVAAPCQRLPCGWRLRTPWRASEATARSERPPAKWPSFVVPTPHVA